MSVLRASTRPGVGSSLSRVRGTRKWRRTWRGVRDTAEIAVWSGRRMWRLLTWCVRHYVLAPLSGLFVWTSVEFGPATASIAWTATAGTLVLAVYGWGMRYPDAYTRWVHLPALAWWRRLAVYRRQWQPATSTAGLTLSKDGQETLPRLGRVRSTGFFDVVRVRLLPGHTIDSWAKSAEQLARVFGVEAVRAYSVPTKPQEVELRCRVKDPLAATVEPSPAADVVDLGAVTVGVREDGQPLTLPANRHTLIAGETGSGKSAALWALVRGVAPAVHAGTLRIVAIDPKGVELAAGEPLWSGYSCSGKPEEAARFLEHAVRLMEARKVTLRGKSRKHEATTDDPAYVVIVDEVAALTAWVGDPKLRGRLTNALSLLLSQGRALGFTVWLATQDARKEVLTLRDLVPARLALRTAEDEQADLILGRGARARGALTDQIDPRTPGVCYVVEDGVPEPVRARIAFVSDEEIARVAARFAPRKLAAVA